MRCRVGIFHSSNLGDNEIVALPTQGLQSLQKLKTFDNENLRDFPPKEAFPKVYNLVLNYAYHCCDFLQSASIVSPASMSSIAVLNRTRPRASYRQNQQTKESVAISAFSPLSSNGLTMRVCVRTIRNEPIYVDMPT